MKIVLTGSIGNIGKPLTKALVKNGHSVTVISSNPKRAQEIEELGAKHAIGQMQDADFLEATFRGSDIVYLMETIDAVGGDMEDQNTDLIDAISDIVRNYKQAVERSGVKRIVHLSSIGAHLDTGNGFLVFHHNAENILKQLPEEVSIKTMRPVGFYTNMFSFIPTIKNRGYIVSNYGGEEKEPWVSPNDIAAVVAEEMEAQFEGRTVRYIASDEVSPNEVAKMLGDSIGKADLQWKVITNNELLDTWVKTGMNKQIARGFIEMQASQGSGKLYEDYYRNRPVLGVVKVEHFAKDFATTFNKKNKG